MTLSNSKLKQQNKQVASLGHAISTTISSYNLIHSSNTVVFDYSNQLNHLSIAKITSINNTLNLPLINGSWALPRLIEAENALAIQYTINIDSTIQGKIGVPGEQDWYKIALVKGQSYKFAEIGTGTNSLSDTYLKLYDASKTLIASDDNSGPGNSSVIAYTATSTGNYFINASSAINETGQYGISANRGLKPSFDVPMGAGALNTNDSWSTVGESVTVTYGFRQSPANYTVTTENISTFSQLSSAQMTAIRTILSLWSDISGIKFQEINPDGYTDDATILIGNYSDATSSDGAFAVLPGSTANKSADGDVWLNLEGGVSRDTITIGSWSFFVIMHELGHALGLSHPGDYDGVQPTYTNSAQFKQDTNQYSVMSYFYVSSLDGSAPNPDKGNVTTPLLLDVYAAQKIYGVNLTTRVNDSIYGFGTNAGDVFDFSINKAPLLCIWDAGGIDTLNCSGFLKNQTINLTQATHSNIGGLTNNISIALGAVIENAVGGSGKDIILGNNSKNSLLGGIGNDILNGLAGNDRILGGLGKDNLTGGLGKDTFVFNSKNEIGKGDIRELITDFTHKQKDKIDLSGIDANSKLAGNQAFTYLASNAFDGEAGEIRFVNHILSGDINGDKVADFAMTINLVGSTTLVNSDFIL